MTAAAPQTSKAMCPQHPQRAATGTCSRCGKFVCELCSGDTRVCAACVRQRLDALPPPTPRARWATRFLTLVAVSSGASCLVSLLTFGSTAPADTESSALLLLEGLLAIFTLVTYLGAVITYLRWLHLAVRHAEALDIKVGATPGWAVGYWFIPFVNLVRPYRVVRALADGLERGPSSAPVGLWWTLWLLSNFADRADMRLSMRQEMLADAPGAGLLSIIASLLNVAAAFLCIRVLQAIQRELDRYREAR